MNRVAMVHPPPRTVAVTFFLPAGNGRKIMDFLTVSDRLSASVCLLPGSCYSLNSKHAHTYCKLITSQKLLFSDSVLPRHANYNLGSPFIMQMYIEKESEIVSYCT